MVWEKIDWRTLERLRNAFLAGAAGERDYWQSLEDLDSYDQTFAQRIGWKWDHVLDQLQQRQWSPPPGALLDWGCGSGVAGRAFLDRFGIESVAALALHDRSALAVQFAALRARDKYPGLAVRTGIDSGFAPAVLLLSHVLTELNEAQVEELLSLVMRAGAVIWVEPGTYEVSRKLVALRERLRVEFNLIAPCPHQAACGLLTPENERHWCHHFAQSPPEIFSDRQWSRFATLAGVDLRSLPLSYLVLDRRPAPALPPGAFRILGHPRVYKPWVTIFGCDETGVCDRHLPKRDLPEEYRMFKRGHHRSLMAWQYEGEKITRLGPGAF